MILNVLRMPYHIFLIPNLLAILLFALRRLFTFIDKAQHEVLLRSVKIIMQFLLPAISFMITFQWPLFYTDSHLEPNSVFICEMQCEPIGFLEPNIRQRVQMDFAILISLTLFVVDFFDNVQYFQEQSALCIIQRIGT